MFTNTYRSLAGKAHSYLPTKDVTIQQNYTTPTILGIVSLGLGQPRPQADFSLRERKGEKEAWDTLYVGVSTEIVICIVKHTVIVQKNVTEMAH